MGWLAHFYNNSTARLDSLTAGYAEPSGPTRTEVRKALTYDLLGRVTSDLERVSGIAHTYRYTPDGYLDRYDVKKPGGALDHLYAVSQFDLLGHPRSYTRTTGRDATGGADGCCFPWYGADGHYRFLSDGLSGPFTYDVAGNRVRELTATQSFVFTYDLANRLLERVEVNADGSHYLHDRSGNRLGHYLFDSEGVIRDNEILTYDAEGRLYASVVEHVYLSGNWAHTWHLYDGLGRRMYAHETSYTFRNTGVKEQDAPGVRKYYVWDGDDVLLKLERNTATGSLIPRARYHLGPGVDDALAATVTSTVGEVKTWYFVRDRLGSVLFLRDAAGGFESSGQTWQYDPWGNSMPGNPDGDKNNAGTEAGYTGASTGEGSGFVYLRNRYYDPKTGRFLTEDPIGFAGGVNFYAYASNNPLSFTDPFGLCPPKDTDTSDCDATTLGEAYRILSSEAGGYEGERALESIVAKKPAIFHGDFAWRCGGNRACYDTRANRIFISHLVSTPQDMALVLTHESVHISLQGTEITFPVQEVVAWNWALNVHDRLPQPEPFHAREASDRRADPRGFNLRVLQRAEEYLRKHGVVP